MPIQIAADPETGKYYRREGSNIAEIDLQEYSQLQTAMDTGSGETIMAQAGKRVSNIPGVTEALQAIPYIGDTWGTGGNQQPQGEMEALSEVRPTSSMIGDLLPYAATAPLSGGLLAQAGAGVLSGAAMGEEGERVKDAAIGGVAAPLTSMAMRVGNQLLQAGSNIAARVTGRTTGKTVDTGDEFTKAYQQAAETAPVGNLSPEESRIMQRGDDLGMVSLPGVEKGDPALKMMEQSLKYNPMKGPVIREVGKRNQEALNRHAAKAIGLGDDVTKVDAQALGKASDQIDAGYRGIEQGLGKIEFDDAVLDNLSAWENRHQKTILPNRDAMKVVDSLIDNLDQTDSLTGKQVMQYRSRIGKQARKMWKDGDELQGEALDELVSILDESVSAQVGGDIGKEWATLGRKWKALKSLETGKGVNEISGDVNQLTVANNLKRMDKGGYQRGRNRSDFYDAVRYAKMNQDIVGQSGSNVNLASQLPQSQLMQKMMEITSEPMGRGLLNMMTNPGAKTAGRIGGATGRGIIPFADEQNQRFEGLLQRSE